MQGRGIPSETRFNSDAPVKPLKIGIQSLDAGLYLGQILLSSLILVAHLPDQDQILKRMFWHYMEMRR